MNIPLILQEEWSVDCGLACVAMILWRYWREVSINDLRKDIEIESWVGTYAPQLWVYLLSQWFACEIVTMNPHLFTLAMRWHTQEEILSYIRKLLSFASYNIHTTALEWYVTFLEAWWILRIQIPHVRDIQEEIQQERPVISLMTTHYLLWETAKFNFHFNVITDISQTHISVLDPQSSKKCWWKQRYLIQDYMFWIHASTHADVDNGCLLRIRLSQ